MAVMMSFTNTAPRPGMLMKSHQPHSHCSPINANNDTSIEIQTMIPALFALKGEALFSFQCKQSSICLFLYSFSLNTYIFAQVCAALTRT